MYSKILFDTDARDKIMEGVNILTEAVSMTLGPRGRNVGFCRGDQKGNIFGRDIVHDGVSVARAIELSDEFQNFGAQVVKEAAQKQVDACGDGTTCVVILAQAILQECIQITSTGVNPMGLRKGLEEGVDRLIKELDKHAKPIKTLAEQIQIATISAGDKELGELVGKTLHDIGVDGVVTIEESKSSETTVVRQQGLQFDKGYYHPLFMTDPKEMIAVAENTYVLVTDKDITSLEDMSTLLEAIAGRGATLTIISPNVGGEALPLLIQNKLAGKLLTLAIQAPSFGQNQKNVLQDIALLTDAKFITQDAGHELKDVVMGDLGFAEHITSTKNETIIVGGRGSKKTLSDRVKSIKKQMETEDNEFDQMKLKERYAKLTNGVAVINVGGHTEIEMKERKERVDDSVHATKAAMEKGIVVGGETIFLKIREMLGDSITDKILYRALEKPFNKLVENAGLDAGQLRERLLSYPDLNMGIDVMDSKLKDLMKAGIIDPLLVPQRALYNALSVSIALLTTGALIVPELKEDALPKL